MKTIIIKNNLHKVMPYIFKRLSEVYYMFSYDENTKVFSHREDKFAIKYDAYDESFIFVAQSSNYCACYKLKDEFNDIYFVISDNGDIYFCINSGRNISRMYIHNELDDNKYLKDYGSFKDIFELWEAIGEIGDDDPIESYINNIIAEENSNLLNQKEDEEWHIYSRI